MEQLVEQLTPSEAFAKLGLSLPPAPLPLGVYKPYLIDGKYLYVSGHGPVQDDKSLVIGRIGRELDMEEGKLAARQVGLTILSTIQTHLGSLDRVKRVIKVLGMVNCVDTFDAVDFSGGFARWHVCVIFYKVCGRAGGII